MMGLTVWGQLKVTEFFTGYNWLGHSSPLETPSFAADNLDSYSLLNLPLQDFLHRHNWGGVRIVETRQPQPKTKLSLTMSVSDYFQSSAWQGIPKVAVVPELFGKPGVHFDENQDMKITDLSELF